MKKYSLSARVLAMLLTVVMLMGMLPSSALSAEAPRYGNTGKQPDVDESQNLGASRAPNNVDWLEGVLNAGAYIANYVETYGELPNNVAIQLSDGTSQSVTMPGFMYLGSKTLQAFYNKQESATFSVPNYALPRDPTGQNVINEYRIQTSCTLSATVAYISYDGDERDYLNRFGTVLQFFMEENGAAPNYCGFAPANFTFPESVYTMARILSSYKSNRTFVAPITVNRWDTYWVSFAGFGEQGSIYRVENAGEVKMSANEKVIAGGNSKQYIIKAANGYSLESLKVGGNAIDIKGDNLSQYTFETGEITRDTVIEATFKENKWMVTFSAGEGAEVKGYVNGEEVSSPANVVRGDSITLKFVAETGYDIASLKVGDKIINAEADLAAMFNQQDNCFEYTFVPEQKVDVIVTAAERNTLHDTGTVFAIRNVIRSYDNGTTRTYVFPNGGTARVELISDDYDLISIEEGQAPWILTDYEERTSYHEFEQFAVKKGSFIGQWDYIKFSGIKLIRFVFDEKKPEVTSCTFDYSSKLFTITVKDEGPEATSDRKNHPDDYSGIKEITYTLKQNGNVVGTTTKEYANNVSVLETTLTDFADLISANESYILEIVAKDAAGNSSATAYSYKFDTKVPNVKVVLTDAKQSAGAEDHYYTEAQFTVYVDDAYFEKAPNKPVIYLGDKPLTGANTVWKKVDGADGVYMATLEAFKEEGKYSFTDWKVVYKTQSGVAATGLTVVEKDQEAEAALDAFHIYNSELVGELILGADKKWSDLQKEETSVPEFTKGNPLNNLDFAHEYTEDRVNPDKGVTFHVSEEAVFLTEEQLATLEAEKWLSRDAIKEAYANKEISKKLVVYMRLMDRAGNVKYISSDRIAIDAKAPVGHATLNCTDDGLFCKLDKGGLLMVAVDVSDYTADAEGNKTSSGIASITYTVVDAVTEKVYKDGAVNDFNRGDELFSKPIAIGLPNVNAKIRVLVTVTDVAGNSSTFKTKDAVLDTKTEVALGIKTDNHNGFYTNDVEIEIFAKDKFDIDHIAGIKEIRYTVKNGNEITQEGILAFKYEEESGKWIMEDSSGINCVVSSVSEGQSVLGVWEGVLTVDAKKNDSENVKVTVEVEDMAGNTATTDVPLNIKIASPTLEIGKAEYTEGEEGKTYATVRITLTDRKDAFVKDIMPVYAEDIGSVPEGYEGLVISFSAVDANGFPARGKPNYEKWIDNKDGTYTLELRFYDDANYTCEISYENKAGQTAKAATAFTLDNQNPEASLSVRSQAWFRVAETLTFGIFDNKELVVFAKVSDVTAGIASVEYHKATGAATNDPYSEEKLKWIVWQPAPEGSDFANAFALCTLDKTIDNSVVVYMKVTDHSGRVTYVSTDGLIVDATAPAAVIITTPKEAGAYYTEDVILGVEAHELAAEEGHDFSGIKDVTYTVKNPVTNEITQEGHLFSFETGEVLPKKEDLKTEWIGTFTVDAEKNNAQGVIVEVTVTDNAGNSKTSAVTLNINSQAPTLDVRFNDEEEVASNDYGYFAGPRVATITLEDREDTFVNRIFVNGELIINGEDIEGSSGLYIRYTALGNDENPVSGAEPIIGSWTNNNGIPTLEVEFAKDARYEWSVSYKNEVWPEEIDGVMTGDNYPNKFVIDTQDPTAEIYAGERPWLCITETIFFGIFEKAPITIKATVSDETAGIASVAFYKATNKDASVRMSKDDLNAIADDQWEALKGTDFSKIFEVCTIERNERAVIYLKVIDGIGRTIYINSNGVVYDNADPGHIILTPVATNGVFVNGYYNADVKVEIDVAEIQKSNENWTDPYNYSGIRLIQCAMEKDGVKGEYFNLYEVTYSYEGDDGVRRPIAEDLENSWNGTITVDAEKYNSDNVKVHIKVVDMADNVTEASCELKINSTDPHVEVSFADNAPNNTDENGYAYFQDARTATIKIKDRADTFTAGLIEGIAKIQLDENMGTKIVEGTYTPDAENPFYGLVIEYTATDVNGKATKDSEGNNIAAPVIGKWSGDDGVYSATLTFSGDANYTWKISYVNKAAMEDKEIQKIGTSFDAFAVDTSDPTGYMQAKTFTWSKLFEVVTFGLYSQEVVRVDGSVKDNTSPIQNVYWYKVSGKDAESALELVTTAQGDKALSNGKNIIPDSAWTLCSWKDSGAVHEINNNEKAVIYLKIVDMSNRVTYISTGGMIVDVKEPSPTLQIDVEAIKDHIYNTDVRIPVSVNDLEAGDVTSGISKVSYWVYNEDAEDSSVPTQFGDLLIFETTRDEKGNPVKVVIKEWNWETNKHDVIKTIEDGLLGAEDLYPSWEGEIIVDASKNNSNNIRVEVRAEDNSNRYKEITPLRLAIDITPPVIEVSYNDVQPDSGFYYSRDRIATVKITERNFDGNAVKFEITGGNPSRSQWTTVKSGGNGDATTHTMTLTYHADGDYTFDIGYTDKAANPATSINMTESFTIDQTAPVIRVTYDNNAVANEKYFKAHRTATVEIVEHNFAMDRVQITQSADRGGQVPHIAWDHEGDRHVATIVYDKDGDYTFDIEMKDKAGNVNDPVDYGTSTAPKDFVVDTTFEDMVTYGGVNKGKAYGRNEDVVPNVKIEDINLDEYTVTLTGAQKGTKIDLTAEVNALLQTGETLVEGIFDIFEKVQEKDGIYTLTIYGKDLAGNEDQEEIVFTVNRFGSVYVYSQYLMGLIANGGSYVNSVTEDLQITEYNADKLLEDSLKIEITRDGRPLEKNPVFTCSPEINDTVAVGESGWYQYLYVIDKSNFALDGIYKISISSQDATGNTPENNRYEDLGIVFRVDSTKPELTSIVGLENDIINKSQVTVDYDVFDAIGIQSVEIYINGESVEKPTDFSAGMNNYSGSFVINESNSQQTVRIVVTDMSGNITDTDADDFDSVYTFHKKVTVSTNFFVRWYANKPLFWGTVGGIAGIGAALWFLLLFKRKKKEEEEAKNNSSKATASSGSSTGELAK